MLQLRASVETSKSPHISFSSFKLNTYPGYELAERRVEPHTRTDVRNLMQGVMFCITASFNKFTLFLWDFHDFHWVYLKYARMLGQYHYCPSFMTATVLNTPRYHQDTRLHARKLLQMPTQRDMYVNLQWTLTKINARWR